MAKAKEHGSRASFCWLILLGWACASKRCLAHLVANTICARLSTRLEIGCLYARVKCLGINDLATGCPPNLIPEPLGFSGTLLRKCSHDAFKCYQGHCVGRERPQKTRQESSPVAFQSTFPVYRDSRFPP